MPPLRDGLAGSIEEHMLERATFPSSNGLLEFLSVIEALLDRHVYHHKKASISPSCAASKKYEEFSIIFSLRYLRNYPLEKIRSIASTRISVPSRDGSRDQLRRIDDLQALSVLPRLDTQRRYGIGDGDRVERGIRQQGVRARHE